jgi:hypothetical protein
MPIEPRILRLTKTMTDDEAEKAFAGKHLAADSYDHLLQSDGDVVDAKTGEYLIRFRRGVLNPHECYVAYKNLRSAASHTDNRGMAAGEIPEQATTIVRGGETVVIGDRSRTRYRQAKPDGTLSNTNRAVTVQSGIIGVLRPKPANSILPTNGLQCSKGRPVRRIVTVHQSSE